MAQRVTGTSTVPGRFSKPKPKWLAFKLWPFSSVFSAGIWSYLLNAVLLMGIGGFWYSTSNNASGTFHNITDLEELLPAFFTYCVYGPGVWMAYVRHREAWKIYINNLIANGIVVDRHSRDDDLGVVNLFRTLWFYWVGQGSKERQGKTVYQWYLDAGLVGLVIVTTAATMAALAYPDEAKCSRDVSQIELRLLSPARQNEVSKLFLLPSTAMSSTIKIIDDRMISMTIPINSVIEATLFVTPAKKIESEIRIIPDALTPATQQFISTTSPTMTGNIIIARNQPVAASIRPLAAALLPANATIQGVMKIPLTNIGSSPACFGYPKRWFDAPNQPIIDIPIISRFSLLSLARRLLLLLSFCLLYLILLRQVAIAYRLNSLEINPVFPHKDGRNGLANIGEFAIGSALIAVLGGLWLFFVAAYPSWFGERVRLDNFTICLLIAYLVAVPLLLLLPLLPVSKKLEEQKAEMLAPIAEQIRILLPIHKIHKKDTNTDTYQYHPSDKMLGEKQLLEALERRFQIIDKEYKIWPFRYVTLRNLLLTAIIPIVLQIISLIISGY